MVLQISIRIAAKNEALKFVQNEALNRIVSPLFFDDLLQGQNVGFWAALHAQV